MNYAWDVAIKADEQGIPINKLKFIPANPISPYSELGFQNLNQSELTDTKIEINGLYRYSAIFETMVDGTLADYPELRDALFDILTHYLIQLDLRQGLCRQEYYQLAMQKDIESGSFGVENAGVLQLFSKAQRQQALIHLVRLYELGPSLRLMRSVLSAVYPKSIMYFSCDTSREVLLYVGHEKTADYVRQVEFICGVFLPIDYSVELFWDVHFGIIGIGETMMTDEIMVF